MSHFIFHIYQDTLLITNEGYKDWCNAVQNGNLAQFAIVDYKALHGLDK